MSQENLGYDRKAPLRERRIVYGGPNNDMIMSNSVMSMGLTQQSMVSQDAMVPGFEEDQWIGNKSQNNLFHDNDDW